MSKIESSLPGKASEEQSLLHSPRFDVIVAGLPYDPDVDVIAHVKSMYARIVEVNLKPLSVREQNDIGSNWVACAIIIQGVIDHMTGNLLHLLRHRPDETTATATHSQCVAMEVAMVLNRSGVTMEAFLEQMASLLADKTFTGHFSSEILTSLQDGMLTLKGNYEITALLFEKFDQLWDYCHVVMMLPAQMNGRQQLYNTCWLMFICIKNSLQGRNADLSSAYGCLVGVVAFFLRRLAVASPPDMSRLVAISKMTLDEITVQAECVAVFLGDNLSLLAFINNKFPVAVMDFLLMHGPLNLHYVKHFVTSIVDFDERIFLDKAVSDQLSGVIGSSKASSSLAKFDADCLSGLLDLGKEVVLVADRTPISASLEATGWLTALSTAYVEGEATPSASLLSHFTAVSKRGSGNLASLKVLIASRLETIIGRMSDVGVTARIHPLRRSTVEEYPKSTLVEFHLRQHVEALYCSALDKMIAMEEKRVLASGGAEMSCAHLVLHEGFNNALLCCCVDVVVLAFNLRSFAFPKSLEICNTDSMTLLKVIESFSLAETQLPRLLKNHLTLIEDRIVESFVWVAGSPVGPMFKSVAACEGDDIIPATLNRSLQHIYTKLLSLAARRLRAMYAALSVKEDLQDVIWTAVSFALEHAYKLLYNRHLDQLLLSAVYGVCRVNKLSPGISFRTVLDKYTTQTSNSIEVIRSIDLTDPDSSASSSAEVARGDVIAYYNQIFIPVMKGYLFQLDRAFTAKSTKQALTPLTLAASSLHDDDATEDMPPIPIPSSRSRGATSTLPPLPVILIFPRERTIGSHAPRRIPHTRVFVGSRDLGYDSIQEDLRMLTKVSYALGAPSSDTSLKLFHSKLAEAKKAFGGLRKAGSLTKRRPGGRSRRASELPSSKRRKVDEA